MTATITAVRTPAAGTAAVPVSGARPGTPPSGGDREHQSGDGAQRPAREGQIGPQRQPGLGAASRRSGRGQPGSLAPRRHARGRQAYDDPDVGGGADTIRTDRAEDLEAAYAVHPKLRPTPSALTQGRMDQQARTGGHRHDNDPQEPVSKGLTRAGHAVGRVHARADALVKPCWHQRALSSRTPTSRCRCPTAGRQVRARESPPGAGRVATGTRVALRSRPLLPARQHVRP